jgi:hypothetical protein
MRAEAPAVGHITSWLRYMDGNIGAGPFGSNGSVHCIASDMLESPISAWEFHTRADVTSGKAVGNIWDPTEKTVPLCPVGQPN